MPIAQAQIATRTPGRYLAQLCKHATKMGRRHTAGMHAGATHAPARPDVEVHADYTDTHGLITFTPLGRCTLTAAAASLTLRIDAADEQSLRTIQDILTRDLQRMGRRDDLTVTWQPART
jgi:hypothetical protein